MDLETKEARISFSASGIVLSRLVIETSALKCKGSNLFWELLVSPWLVYDAVLGVLVCIGFTTFTA